MNKQDSSPPAFPGCGGNPTVFQPSGLTQREFYAGLAMAGYCANPDVQAQDPEGQIKADWAVRDADSLIERLKR